MRVFLAIDLPEHVKSRIFHKFEVIAGKRLFKGKIVEKNNLHLTLNFFGDITEKQVSIIKNKLKSIDFGKIECEIGRVGVFDNEEKIKVIWFELICKKIEDLQGKICGVLNIKNEGFNPHITVARVREVVNRQELLKEIKSLSFKNLKFEVGEIVLFKSILTSSGPKYKVIEKFNL